MGCKSTKPSASEPVEAKTTLLQSPDVAKSPEEAAAVDAAADVTPSAFSIFMDSVGTSLVVAEDPKMLRVEDPIAMLRRSCTQEDNRGRMEKVKKGDLVVQVRKAGAAQWVGDDGKMMLDALMAEGPFEVQIKREMPEETQQSAQESATAVKEEAPITVEPPKEEPVAQSTEEPAATTEEPVAQLTTVEDMQTVDDTTVEAKGSVSAGGCGFCSF